MFKLNKLSKILILVFILLVFMGSLSLKKQYVAPIMMYHYFTYNANPNDKLNTKPDIFERQMRFLRRHKYDIVPLEVLAEMIKQGSKIPRRTITVTMDDGYVNNYTYAFPILKKYKIPATVFLIYDEVERPQNDRLSWAQIKEMQDSGLVTFGSHTLGPNPLINIKSDEELKRQIFNSKKLLEDKLGRLVNTFSYPEGFFTDKIKQLVKDAGYKCAVATSPGSKFSSSDIFALKRLMISSYSGDTFIFWVQISGYYTAMREFQKRHKEAKRNQEARKIK